jgi:hypothetical protein
MPQTRAALRQPGSHWRRNNLPRSGFARRTSGPKVDARRRRNAAHDARGLGTAVALERSERRLPMTLLLLIIVLLLVFGGLPTWGYHSYGYGPSGVGGVILIILLILLLTGRMNL